MRNRLRLLTRDSCRASSSYRARSAASVASITRATSDGSRVSGFVVASAPSASTAASFGTPLRPARGGRGVLGAQGTCPGRPSLAADRSRQSARGGGGSSALTEGHRDFNAVHFFVARAAASEGRLAVRMPRAEHVAARACAAVRKAQAGLAQQLSTGRGAWREGRAALGKEMHAARRGAREGRASRRAASVRRTMSWLSRLSSPVLVTA